MWFMLFASVLQAFAQKKAADYQAQEVDQQADDSMLRSQQARADKRASDIVGEAEGVETMMAGEAQQASERVRMGASGGRLDVGTNFLLGLQNKAWAEWDTFKKNYGSRARSDKFQAEANWHVRDAFRLRAKSQNIRTMGRTQMFGTIMGGLGKSYLLSGGGNSPNYSTTTSNAGGTTPNSIITGNRFGSN